MAGEWIPDPRPEQIQAMCAAFQESWSEQERKHRLGSFCDDDTGWSVPQFLPHHCETGTWAKGRERKVVIWRCVNGR
jgi:hypothetical protein